jgi:hypothetical protein
VTQWIFYCQGQRCGAKSGSGSAWSRTFLLDLDPDPEFSPADLDPDSALIIDYYQIVVYKYTFVNNYGENSIIFNLKFKHFVKVFQWVYIWIWIRFVPRCRIRIWSKTNQIRKTDQGHQSHKTSCSSRIQMSLWTRIHIGGHYVRYP